uniref:(northern house mosquito) hypothetical protein n=1 Tax=Culex pipiens TaxID=7175 RepID=A0A8D7ZW04_CULPI
MINCTNLYNKNFLSEGAHLPFSLHHLTSTRRNSYKTSTTLTGNRLQVESFSNSAVLIFLIQPPLPKEDEHNYFLSRTCSDLGLSLRIPGGTFPLQSHLSALQCKIVLFTTRFFLLINAG